MEIIGMICWPQLRTPKLYLILENSRYYMPHHIIHAFKSTTYQRGQGHGPDALIVPRAGSPTFPLSMRYCDILFALSTDGIHSGHKLYGEPEHFVMCVLVYVHDIFWHRSCALMKDVTGLHWWYKCVPERVTLMMRLQQMTELASHLLLRTFTLIISSTHT